ncbi:hypothetical protein [Ruegeria atlantica]|uniref:hypothetical protein n=1 Tax=Ruegeria atlantica TaxID=81569 RepID=UPI00147B7F8C|nr:hypothetical protein [Ruegeria atlantica]
MAYTKGAKILVKTIGALGVLVSISAPFLEVGQWNPQKWGGVNLLSWFGAIAASTFVVDWMATAEDNPQIGKAGAWVIGIYGFVAFLVLLGLASGYLVAKQ